MTTKEQRAEWARLAEEAWDAPWVAHTFEIDCPCPNGEDCGDLHTCEEVEAPEAYPASHDDPAEPGDGQCVVQISVPGLESLARPTAEFIAASRTAVPALLADLAAAESERDAAREALEAAAKSLEWIANRQASSIEQRTSLDVLSEVRRYATSRASVARAALAGKGGDDGR